MTWLKSIPLKHKPVYDLKVNVVYCYEFPDKVVYIVMLHSPGELEHEFFRLSNLFYRDENAALKRCVDGFMVCLGNKITSEEWTHMRGFWEYPWKFLPVEAGDFTWIFDYDGIGCWRDDGKRQSRNRKLTERATRRGGNLGTKTART